MKFIAKAFAPFVMVALSCMSVAASHAADDSKVAAAVDRAFRPLLQKYDVPGMAVAVTVDRKQNFFTYGVVSKDGKAPVTKDTLFEIGSVSKTFAATLAAYGQVRGQLSLDDHPAKYMPALQGSALDKVTLLNLGTYTAGDLPLQFPGEVRSNADMERYFAQLKPAAEPGALRSYSNPSLGLLGHVSALAMKGDYADLVEREIFPKLGLTHSFVRVPKAEMANYAWGHNRDNKQVRATPGVLDGPAYGVKSSAADLIRYVEAQIRPDTLEGSMRAAIEATHIGYFKTGPMTQGLGWEQYPYPVTRDTLLAGNATGIVMKPNATSKLNPPRVPTEPTLFNKTGSTGGFGAYVMFVPAKKIGIVMLANKNFSTQARIEAAHAVLQQLAAD